MRGGLAGIDSEKGDFGSDPPTLGTLGGPVVEPEGEKPQLSHLLKERRPGSQRFDSSAECHSPQYRPIESLVLGEELSEERESAAKLPEAVPRRKECQTSWLNKEFTWKLARICLIPRGRASGYVL